jgi:CheY-specific phosphatase CheX
MKSIVDLVSTIEKNGVAALNTKEVAISLGQTEDTIRRASALLEYHGHLRMTRTGSDLRAQSFTLTTPGQSPIQTPTQDAEGASRDRVVTALLRGTSRYFKSKLNMGVTLTGGETRDIQETTEEFSVFVRVSGQLEGSICFGLSRIAASAVIDAIVGQHIGGIDDHSVQFLNSMANRIIASTCAELAIADCSFEVLPASTVRSSGMRITTNGTPQVIATLSSEHGLVVVHVVLRDPEADKTLAA